MHGTPGRWRRCREKSMRELPQSHVFIRCGWQEKTPTLCRLGLMHWTPGRRRRYWRQSSLLRWGSSCGTRSSRMQQQRYLWRVVPLGAWGNPEEEQPSWLLLGPKEQARSRKLPSCLGQKHTSMITSQTKLLKAKEKTVAGICSSTPAGMLLMGVFGYRFRCMYMFLFNFRKRTSAASSMCSMWSHKQDDQRFVHSSHDKSREAESGQGHLDL